MAPLKPGRLLSPEQSMRLTILDNVSRARAIEYIVKHLRKDQPGGGTPSLQTMYRRTIR